jgi:hypothetical protein
MAFATLLLKTCAARYTRILNIIMGLETNGQQFIYVTSKGQMH